VGAGGDGLLHGLSPARALHLFCNAVHNSAIVGFGDRAS
jgi:hypothetical protein